jgi:signal transduction histidine kinase
MEAVVTVEDSGPGLDAANAERIFEAFFTTKPGGMGMGLSISTSIVEAHGGRLWASPNLPHGTAFHVKLPAASGADAHSDKRALVIAC